MRRAAILVGVAALGAGALAGTVYGDRTIIQDPSGDSKGNNIDIVSAKAGHAPGGVLKHRATFAKKVNPHDDAPHLLINVPGGSGVEYTVAVTENGAALLDPAGTPVGKASVTPVGEQGFKYKFREKAIGSPRRYRWAFAVVDEEATVFDRAPDSGFVKHKL